LTFDNRFYTISVTPMEDGETTEDLYNRAKNQHAALDRRLNMLAKKAYLTLDEETEITVLKKQKLHSKDIMERLSEELQRGE
jgi:hypothetical protein